MVWMCFLFVSYKNTCKTWKKKSKQPTDLRNVSETQEKFVLAITFIYYFMALFYCFTTFFLYVLRHIFPRNFSFEVCLILITVCILYLFYHVFFLYNCFLIRANSNTFLYFVFWFLAYLLLGHKKTSLKIISKKKYFIFVHKMTIWVMSQEINI